VSPIFNTRTGSHVGSEKPTCNSWLSKLLEQNQSPCVLLSECEVAAS
jgi:hypothetical protein